MFTRVLFHFSPPPTSHCLELLFLKTVSEKCDLAAKLALSILSCSKTSIATRSEEVPLYLTPVRQHLGCPGLNFPTQEGHRCTGMSVAFWATKTIKRWDYPAYEERLTELGLLSLEKAWWDFYECINTWWKEWRRWSQILLRSVQWTDKGNGHKLKYLTFKQNFMYNFF